MSRVLTVDTTDFRVEITGDAIAEVTLGQPGKLPTLDARGHAELARLWGRLAVEPDVRCVLVRSVGTGFCAGGDFALVREMQGDAAVRNRVMREAREIVQGMLDCEVPIVSAINGAAVGAGAAVALLADVSIVARTAKIIDGHTRIGVAAGDHAVAIWPLLCGLAKARYYLLTSTPLTGEEAERIGLVSLVVDDADLESASRRVAGQLTAGSRSALAFTKRSLAHWVRAAWPAFEHSLALEMLGFTGADAREGLRAVAEKRAPRFEA